MDVVNLISIRDNQVILCTTCKGTGQLKVATLKEFIYSTETCFSCKGTGRLMIKLSPYKEDKVIYASGQIGEK